MFSTAAECVHSHLCSCAPLVREGGGNQTTELELELGKKWCQPRGSILSLGALSYSYPSVVVGRANASLTGECQNASPRIRGVPMTRPGFYFFFSLLSFLQFFLCFFFFLQKHWFMMGKCHRREARGNKGALLHFLPALPPNFTIEPMQMISKKSMPMRTWKRMEHVAMLCDPFLHRTHLKCWPALLWHSDNQNTGKSHFGARIYFCLRERTKVQNEIEAS